LEAGSQSARGAPWGCRVRGRRRRKKDKEASWEGSERGGKRAGVEDRKEGTTEDTVGAAGSLYPGQAARGRDPRSGGAKPEEAAHRHRFYLQKTCVFTVRSGFNFKDSLQSLDPDFVQWELLQYSFFRLVLSTGWSSNASCC
jgi:hypothetical protein